MCLDHDHIMDVNKRLYGESAEVHKAVDQSDKFIPLQLANRISLEG